MQTFGGDAVGTKEGRERTRYRDDSLEPAKRPALQIFVEASAPTTDPCEPMNRRDSWEAQASGYASVDHVGAIAMRVNYVGPQTGAQTANRSALAAIGTGRYSDNRMFDPQGVEERMFFGSGTVEYGYHMNAVSPGRLAGCEGQYHALEPAYLPWRNHMYNRDIVVCLQHSWLRARVAQGCSGTRKHRRLCLLAKVGCHADALVCWP